MVEISAILKIGGQIKNPDENDSTRFQMLKLTQCFFDHSEFKVLVDHQRLETKVFQSPEQKVALIGEDVLINIRQNNDMGTEIVFAGTITNVKILAKQGLFGYLELTGKGKTAKIDRGRRLQTYSKTKLKEIVDQITLAPNLKVSNKPKYDKPIDFSFQYNQSDFEYLKKLAKKFNETLFYDGTKLIFGEYTPQKVELTYDKELFEVELNSRLIPNTFVDYFIDENNVISDTSPTFDDTSLLGVASKQSDKLNEGGLGIPIKPFSTAVETFDQLEELSKRKKHHNLNEMIFVTGACKTADIRIGCLLKIKFPSDMEVGNLGSYRVTKVQYCFDEVDRFSSTFEAIPSQIEQIPYPEMPKQVVDSLRAVVYSNVPSGEDSAACYGKIQVRFQFDKNYCRKWMEVLTPDGGGTGSRKNNRGFSFVPELLDDVIVSFHDGDPDFPYVIGCLKHGKNNKNSGGGKGNHIKSISDKANNYVEWNSGAGIMIMDQGGNKVHLDGGGNITVQSSNTIKLICKPSEEGGGNGSCLEMDKDGNITLTGKIFDATLDEKVKVLSKIEAEYEGTSTLKVKSDVVTIEGVTATSMTGGGGTIVEAKGFVDIN